MLLKAYIAGLLTCLLASSAWAGQLDASWSAVTTNTDGTPVNGPVTYRVYYFLFPNTPCPGNQFLVTPANATGITLTGLTQGMTYNAQVTAVDALGAESACSLMASAVARADTGALPLPASNVQIVFSIPSPPPTGFTVTGLVANQVVKGLLRVSAAPNAGVTATGAVFTLKNAAGAVILTNAEGGVPYCFVGDPGALPCNPFNTATVPNGAYTMTVTMATTPSSPAQVIPFTIGN